MRNFPGSKHQYHLVAKQSGWGFEERGRDGDSGLIGLTAVHSLLISSHSPFYVRGCAIGCALTGCIVVFALGLYAKLVHENKVRDRLYGSVDENVRVDVTGDGDNNPQFRYLV